MAGYSFSETPCDVATVGTKYRSIKTALPVPESLALLKTLSECEARSMQGQLPVIWNRARQFQVWDRYGNCWIDFTSSIFVANTGHANPRVVAALRDMLEKELLHTYAYGSEIRVRYLEKLIASTTRRFEKAFLLSAGTEATEAALKLMRLNGKENGKRRPGVICIEGNWHGRTLGAQMMCSRATQKEWIGYQDPNIHHIPFPYPWLVGEDEGARFLETGMRGLADAGVDVEEDVCGFMLETFQGWGAVFYPVSFVHAVRETCDKYGLLMTFDEMQSGFARTGRLFGYEHYGVEPDLLCCGKGIASGLPLSAVLGAAQVMDLPGVGEMSSTHSANPLVCAAGLATLEEIESRDLVGEAERRGRILLAELGSLKERYPERISYVLGRGMLAAVHFVRPETGEADAAFASQVAERCMHKGLLVVHTGRESIKIAPPIIIEDEALLEGIAVLDEAISELCG